MFNKSIDIQAAVAEIVRTDYRAADVFKKHGINFCCSGQVTLQAACDLRNLDYEAVIAELHEATRSVRLPNSLQFGQWKMDFLADYIMNVHHAYLYQAIPAMEVRLNSFIEGHKKKYPELMELQEIFTAISKILLQHIQFEDENIFPYIKQIDAAHRRKEPYGHLFVRTFRKPLAGVEAIHEKISMLLKKLKSATHDFNYPTNACTNHQVIYHHLKEFHDDMLQHMHLENNILYPRVIETERLLLGK